MWEAVRRKAPSGLGRGYSVSHIAARYSFQAAAETRRAPPPRGPHGSAGPYLSFSFRDLTSPKDDRRANSEQGSCAALGATDIDRAGTLELAIALIGATGRVKQIDSAELASEAQKTGSLSGARREATRARLLRTPGLQELGYVPTRADSSPFYQRQLTGVLVGGPRPAGV